MRGCGGWCEGEKEGKEKGGRGEGGEWRGGEKCKRERECGWRDA